jgi:phage-related tail fiber protein
MLLGSALDANSLMIYNLDVTTTESSAAASLGRVSTVESNLTAAISTLQSQFNAAINQLDIKTGCRVAATSNIDIATGGTMTIQGVSLNPNDRALLTAQTIPAENGIYVVANGAWSRAGDADTAAEVTSALAVPVAEGDTANRALWLLTTPDPIVLGTTSLAFARSRNLHDLSISGGGLNLSPSFILSLVGTANRISVSGAGIDIDANYSGQGSITTLGTIGAGTWGATEIAVDKGGTGATSAAAARVNLGVAEEYSSLVGNGVDLNHTVTHSLNNENVMVSVMRVSDKKKVEVDVTFGTNTVTIGFSGAAPASNSHKVVVLGVKKP